MKNSKSSYPTYSFGEELSKHAGTIGGVIGGVAGSIVPGVGTAVGASIGTGLGSAVGALTAKDEVQTLPYEALPSPVGYPTKGVNYKSLYSYGGKLDKMPVQKVSVVNDEDSLRPLASGSYLVKGEKHSGKDGGVPFDSESDGYIDGLVEGGEVIKDYPDHLMIYSDRMKVSDPVSESLQAKRLGKAKGSIAKTVAGLEKKRDMYQKKLLEGTESGYNTAVLMLSRINDALAEVGADQQSRNQEGDGTFRNGGKLPKYADGGTWERYMENPNSLETNFNYGLGGSGNPFGDAVERYREMNPKKAFVPYGTWELNTPQEYPIEGESNYNFGSLENNPFGDATNRYRPPVPNVTAYGKPLPQNRALLPATGTPRPPQPVPVTEGNNMSTYNYELGTDPNYNLGSLENNPFDNAVQRARELGIPERTKAQRDRIEAAMEAAAAAADAAARTGTTRPPEAGETRRRETPNITMGSNKPNLSTINSVEGLNLPDVKGVEQTDAPPTNTKGVGAGEDSNVADYLSLGAQAIANIAIQSKQKTSTPYRRIPRQPYVETTPNVGAMNRNEAFGRQLVRDARYSGAGNKGALAAQVISNTQDKNSEIAFQDSLREDQNRARYLQQQQFVDTQQTQFDRNTDAINNQMYNEALSNYASVASGLSRGVGQIDEKRRRRMIEDYMLKEFYPEIYRDIYNVRDIPQVR